MTGMNPAMHREDIMKKRILIVDDDTSVRDALKKLLKKANYDASVAADGLEAVERFFSEHFHLLILDLDMPRKDGWAASENITRLNPYVPIVIMTGLPDQYAIASAAGAGAIFEKPFDPEDLLGTINGLLEEPRSNHWLRRRSWLQDARLIPKTKIVARRRIGNRSMIQCRLTAPDNRTLVG
jgi:DNA-binding NtrC family response regulator